MRIAAEYSDIPQAIGLADWARKLWKHPAAIDEVRIESNQRGGRRYHLFAAGGVATIVLDRSAERALGAGRNREIVGLLIAAWSDRSTGPGT